jgi:hypothetical protein
MARMFTAETLLQGRTLSSFGAHAWQAGRSIEPDARSERRENAGRAGNPDETR